MTVALIAGGVVFVALAIQRVVIARSLSALWYRLPHRWDDAE